jgi:hypothetical protein
VELYFRLRGIRHNYLLPRVEINMPLTNLQCDKAKPQDKAYRLPDGAGMFLWITPAGRKIWRMRYRFSKGGKEKTLVFGGYGSLPTIPLHGLAQKIKKLSSPNSAGGSRF